MTLASPAVAHAADVRLLLIIKSCGGDIRFNTDYPDGIPRELLDVAKLGSLGWEASTDLRHGIETTYQWFKDSAPARTSSH